MWHVMIVDDESSILDGLEQIVPWEEYGLEVIARAATGTQALERLKEGDIHILITDIQMPGLSGLELIEQARAMQRGLRTIILTAHDAFAYVKKAIGLGVENYLLKPINRMELSETLLKTIENLEQEQMDAFGQIDRETFRSNILNRWVSDSIEPHELAERAEIAHIDLHADGYVVVAIKSLDITFPDRQNSFMKIARTVLEHFQGEAFHNPVGNVILLLRGKNLQEKITALETLIRKSLQFLRLESDLSTFAAIGQYVQDASLVSVSYQSALSLLSFSMLKPSESVIAFLNPSPSVLTMDFRTFERGFMEENQENRVPFIQEFLRQLSKATASGLPEAKFVILNLLFRIMPQAMNASRQAGDVPPFLKDPLSKFESVLTFEALQEWLITVLSGMARYTAEARRDQNPLLQTILVYLKDHYADEISLKTLSQKYRINASYLGQLFKTETGELFSNYLNNLRLEKAEKLIRTEPSKVGDIALKVGYNNISHFNHNFKKRYGVTPMKYRQQ